MIAGMVTQAKLIRGVARWPGTLDAKFLPPKMRLEGNRLAGFAKAGDWPEVFMVLDDERDWVVPYQWRPGGKEWFTVLHQAAWHGAPDHIVDKLIKRGALRSLRDAKGRLPIDVACQQDHPQLIPKLKPPKPAVHPELLSQMNAPLNELIYGFGPDLVGESNPLGAKKPGDVLRKILRCPPVEILPELPRQRLWFPIPGTEAGFRVTLLQGFLEVVSWSAELKGFTLPTHVVTPTQILPVDSGFI
jgi:Ankyrin repeats (many copies)